MRVRSTLSACGMCAEGLARIGVVLTYFDTDVNWDECCICGEPTKCIIAVDRIPREFAIGDGMLKLKNVNTFKQLLKSGPTWDGNIVSKSELYVLRHFGWAANYNGWNYVTDKGVKAAFNYRLLKE